jgi:hypothetical protein
MSKYDSVVEVNDELFDEIREAYLKNPVLFDSWLRNKFDLPDINDLNFYFGFERIFLIGQPTCQKRVEVALGAFVGICPGVVIFRGNLEPDYDVASLITRSPSKESLFISRVFSSNFFNLTIGYDFPQFLRSAQFAGFPVLIRISYDRDTGNTYGITRERWQVVEPWLNKFLPNETSNCS